MSWMREHMKILMWVTAIIFVVPFVGGYIFRYFTGITGEARRFIATVNSERIPTSRFTELFGQMRERRRKQGNRTIGPDELDKLRQEAFTQLINQTLLQQAVTREGAEATRREIRQSILNSDIFRNQQGRVDPRRVQQFLDRLSDRRRERLLQAQRRQIETVRMNRWISAQVSLGDTESQLLEEISLTSVNLYGIYIDPKTYIDSKKVRQFYERKKSQYRRPPRAYARHILLKPDTATSTGTNPLASIKETVETIRRRLRVGDDFAQLAKEYSDDPTTARKGGSLGWVTPNELNSQLSSAIFGESSGDTVPGSKLFRSDRGYHLLKVETGPVRNYKPLSEVESRIRSQLLTDSHWARAEDKANRLHEKISGSNNLFSRFKQLALLHSESDYFSSRAGHYGWVPTKFIIPDQYSNALEWEGELAENNVVLDPISNTISGMKPSRLSQPVRHQFGYHLFYVAGRKEPNLTKLSDTQTRFVRRRLLSRKKRNYTNTWLERKRRQASIDLKVPESRIGGSPDWLDS